MNPPLTYDQFLSLARQRYGDAGLFAVETSCLTSEDLMKGETHCLDRIAPALEEELSAQNGDAP